MKEMHQHLMITATEWEAFLDDLQQSLDKFAVLQAEQAEIKAIVASTRADIVVYSAFRLDQEMREIVWPIADIRALTLNVRFWGKADMAYCTANVRL
jgi:hypothetical protein